MKEIVVQSAGNAAQQGNVDVVLVENLVHMGPRTANVFGQPCGRGALLSHDFLDMLPDVHRKSVELISCLKLGVTTPHQSNKYSTPYYGVNNLSLIGLSSKRTVVI